VSKDYQKKTARTSTTATGRAATTVAGTGQPVPVLPDVVSVAMSEIARMCGRGCWRSRWVRGCR
jgi:hypothetical protein